MIFRDLQRLCGNLVFKIISQDLLGPLLIWPKEGAIFVNFVSNLHRSFEGPSFIT